MHYLDINSVIHYSVTHYMGIHYLATPIGLPAEAHCSANSQFTTAVMSLSTVEVSLMP